MRQVVGGRAVDRRTASTSQMAGFETELLTQPQNLSALMAFSGKWVDGVRQASHRLLQSSRSSVAVDKGREGGPELDTVVVP